MSVLKSIDRMKKTGHTESTINGYIELRKSEVSHSEYNTRRVLVALITWTGILLTSVAVSCYGHEYLMKKTQVEADAEVKKAKVQSGMVEYSPIQSIEYDGFGVPKVTFNNMALTTEEAHKLHIEVIDKLIDKEKEK